MYPPLRKELCVAKQAPHKAPLPTAIHPRHLLFHAKLLNMQGPPSARTSMPMAMTSTYATMERAHTPKPQVIVGDRALQVHEVGKQAWSMDTQLPGGLQPVILPPTQVPFHLRH